jgi:hypothetical protein
MTGAEEPDALAVAASGPAIGIGSTIWVFDINRRSYAKPEPGHVWGQIIWREHWGPHRIVAETGRSWVLDRPGGLKVPKKGADPSRFAFSQLDIDRRAWIEDNRHSIERAVGRVQDYELLQAVAKLIGYQSKSPAGS